jgi:AmmeMemoRadiSam system protein B
MALISAYLAPHPPLIFPEIGRGEERGIQSTIDAYERLGAEVRAASPDTIVVVSPHSVMYHDYIHISPGAGASGDMGTFRSPQVKVTVKYDEEFAAALAARAKAEGVPAGTEGERNPALDHGTMIPLRFIGQGDYRAVRIGIAALPLAAHFALGKAIAAVSGALGRNTVLIASGDLSHKLKTEGPYGFAPEGPQFDQKIREFIKAGAIKNVLTLEEGFCERAAECGLRPLAVLAGALDGKAFSSELYSYEGPFGVGYGVGGFVVKAP